MSVALSCRRFRDCIGFSLAHPSRIHQLGYAQPTREQAAKPTAQTIRNCHVVHSTDRRLAPGPGATRGRADNRLRQITSFSGAVSLLRLPIREAGGMTIKQLDHSSVVDD